MWFTPILKTQVVLDALARWKAQSLAVLADEDPVPAGVDAQHLGDLIESVVTENTNHALERVDAVESVRVLESVVAEVRKLAQRIR